MPPEIAAPFRPPLTPIGGRPGALYARITIRRIGNSTAPILCSSPTIEFGRFVATNYSITTVSVEVEMIRVRPPIGCRGQLKLLMLAASTAFAALLPTSTLAQTPLPFDAAQVRSYFEEAQRVADKEGGKLWGRTLYGPILFVDYQDRSVVANQQDAQGYLQQDGDLFKGQLTDDITPSNTSIEWLGTRWTMMIWQYVPEDRLEREKLFAHELFHRIQPALGLDAADKLNLHLDSVEGRIWLQLEWRALAAALTSAGTAQDQAIKDALAFREYRHKMFPGSAENERSQEIAEGIPEYTGIVAAAPDTASARWYVVGKLVSPDLTMSLVRASAYSSGPPYGLLLDQRLSDWRSKLSVESDLAALLASTIKRPAVDLKARAKAYGEASIRIAEKDRAEKIEATKARYRKLLVEGPTLILPGSENARFTFNPTNIVSLDEIGAVYPTFHVTDDWGMLDVTDGALRPKGVHQVIVAAPTKISGQQVEGPGWTLELAEGWSVVPVADSKNFTIEKQ